MCTYNFNFQPKNVKGKPLVDVIELAPWWWSWYERFISSVIPQVPQSVLRTLSGSFKNHKGFHIRDRRRTLLTPFFLRVIFTCIQYNVLIYTSHFIQLSAFYASHLLLHLLLLLLHHLLHLHLFLFWHADCISIVMTSSRTAQKAAPKYSRLT